MSATAATKRILVCDRCLRAICYHGEMMCDEAVGAGTVAMTVRELRKLKLEHPENWGARKMTEVYGCSDPLLPEGHPDLAIMALTVKAPA